MNSNELRKLFLDFFAEKGHIVRQSASLIPDDPGLLFTVAGMVPFKNYFMGNVPLKIKKAASSQKCIRTNDIENVGRTRRHHTFFEMLGNFSFGDYFKEEAITWAWEFLTETVKLPKNRMYISIYTDDDEAYKIWNEKIKIPENRIFRMGKETNFWEMAETGPCGYCSEIYFDLEGGEKGEVTVEDIEENDDRFLEIWNLVFTEFDKKSDGSMGELTQKNIDTGMGLERLAAVSQGVYSNFETDLFMPVIKDAAEKCGKEYGKDEKTDISLRVIADHSRSAAFLIGDGVLPSNEGRGYVLRRIIRRAVRHGRLLGIREPFLYMTVPVVMRVMGEAYPDVAGRKEYIMQIIELEENKFQETMDKGMDILAGEIKKVEASGRKELPAEAAFKLYDTYGFPVEITMEILEEKGISLDKAGFNVLMEKQREKAKKAWKGVNPELTSRIPGAVIEKIKVTGFSGYEKTKESGCVIAAMASSGKNITFAKKGEETDIILDKTCFYAESGGQAGDKGLIETASGSAEVYDTKKIDEIIVHFAKVTKGSIKQGEKADIFVNEKRRNAIKRNHTATHLLHAALRAMLGSHVEQAGSFVGDDRLRFDFTHFSPLSAEEIKRTEKLVNEWIWENYGVITDILSFEDAKSRGAMALFEEKYDEKVRTVSIGRVSLELCGGTHLDSTGETGLFKIVSSGSTAAGVRRIEAVTGAAAYSLISRHDDVIKELKEKFKAGDLHELKEKIEKMITAGREMEKQLEDKKKKDVLKSADEYIDNADDVNGVKVITSRLKNADKKAVRALGDILKQKTRKTVSVIANEHEGKVSFLAVVSDDIAGTFSASDIVKRISAVCGGGGGGRKDMAEAGGKDVSKIDGALALALEIVSGKS